MLFMVWNRELNWITNYKAKLKNWKKQDVTVEIVKIKNSCKQPWQFQYGEILKMLETYYTSFGLRCCEKLQKSYCSTFGIPVRKYRLHLVEA